MRIHISSAPRRKPYNPKFGDRKVVKGVEYVRVYRMSNIGTPHAPRMAYDCTGGKQCYDWITLEEYNIKFADRPL